MRAWQQSAIANAVIDPIPYIFWGYVLAGPFFWGVLIWATLRGRHRMNMIHRTGAKLETPAPSVAVLIPAKDEEAGIARCVQSILDQDYPELQIIVVNDRSEDRTGEVLDALAEKHPQLKVVHIQDSELPEGWTGKCNALHRGVQHADADYLVFVDSDVEVDRHGVRDCIAYMDARNVDLFSLLPRLKCEGFFEAVVGPIAGAALSTQMLVPLTNHNHHVTNAFANGQVMLFRRSTYDQIGGHSSVRDRYCEDVHFARLVKHGGGRVRVSLGYDLAMTRMYSSLPTLIRGWARIFYATSVGFPKQILLTMLFTVVSWLSVLGALAMGVYRTLAGYPEWWVWFVAGGIHLGLMGWLLVKIHRWAGNPGWYAAFFPLAALLLLAIHARALMMCVSGKVHWRGTSYAGLSQSNDMSRVKRLRGANASVEEDSSSPTPKDTEHEHRPVV